MQLQDGFVCKSCYNNLINFSRYKESTVIQHQLLKQLREQDDAVANEKVKIKDEPKEAVAIESQDYVTVSEKYLDMKGNILANQIKSNQTLKIAHVSGSVDFGSEYFDTLSNADEFQTNIKVETESAFTIQEPEATKVELGDSEEIMEGDKSELIEDPRTSYIRIVVAEDDEEEMENGSEESEDDQSTQSEEINSLQCSLCNESFSSLENLRLHQISCVKEIESAPAKKSIVKKKAFEICPYCGKTIQKEKLRIHFAVVHKYWKYFTCSVRSFKFIMIHL